jgi:hypothetical protein
VAKQSGLGDGLLIDGIDLSGDINSLGEIGGGNDPLTSTGINKSAMERLSGLRDGRINFTSYFNPAAGAAHPVLSSLPTDDVILGYLRGTAAGSPAACLVAKQIDYNGTRGDDGAFTFEVAAQANDFGLEWGENIGGAFDHGSATDSASLDGGAASSFGLQAYLFLTAFTGTSVTVTLEESSDDGAGDTFAAVTDGAFAAMSAVGAQRIATANDQAVEQYVRFSTSGTFSNAEGYVILVRNQTAVVF